MSTTARPLALFISYSHKDDRLRAKLDAHLSLLKRQNVFDVWHDRRIAAGREWAGEIDHALEQADVVLLLVSADFLASDYCFDKEMMRALQRHDEGSARVVPVILRPCDWHSSQFGKLQALPCDGRAVVSYPDADVAFTEIAIALRVLADEIRGGVTAPSATSPGTAAPTRLPPSSGQPAPGQRKKLKTGAIKLGFFEIGPFELDWPRRPTAILLIVLTVSASVTLAGMIYWISLKPQLDEARDFMRRAEYTNAASTIDSAPRWSKALPFVASIAAQARLGSKLAGGEHIRNLAPELDALRARYPNEPDVLVFQGLKSYYVDNQPEKALDQFTQAANCDPAHVEAHFLAAGRHIDLAYAALGQGAEQQAEAAAVKARSLIERAVSRSPWAKTLPRYANQIGELYELEGNVPRAYVSYTRVAPLHSLSALQAVFVSWRLPRDNTELQHSLENAENATTRIGTKSEHDSEIEGWSFRTDAADLVDVRSKAEKLCLFAWAVRISKSLQSTLDSTVPPENAVQPERVLSPLSCGEGAVAARIREIICVQVLTAQRAIPRSDLRQTILEKWRGSGLQCGQDLQPLPVLSTHGSDSILASIR